MTTYNYKDWIYSSSTANVTEAIWYTVNGNGQWVVLKNKKYEEQNKLKEIENMKEYEDLFE